MQGSSACLVSSFTVPKKTDAPGLIRLTRQGSWLDWPRIKIRGKLYQVAEPVVDLEAAKLLRRMRCPGWQVTWDVYKACGVILGNEWNMGKGHGRSFRRCLKGLAQLAGVTKATVSAYLRILRDLGMISIQGSRFRTYTLLTPKDHSMRRRNKPTMFPKEWIRPVIDDEDLQLLFNHAEGNKTARRNVIKVYDTLWLMSQNGKDGWVKFQDSNVQKISEVAGLSAVTTSSCIKQLQKLRIIEKTIGQRKRTFKILSIKLWLKGGCVQKDAETTRKLIERNMNELTVTAKDVTPIYEEVIDVPTVLPFIISNKENPSEEDRTTRLDSNQENKERSTKNLDSIIQKCKDVSYELLKKRSAAAKQKYGKVSSDVFEHEWHRWMTAEYPGYVPYKFSPKELGMANHFLHSIKRQDGVADAFLYQVVEDWLKFAREAEWINFPRHFADGPVWQIVYTFKSKFLEKAYYALHREWLEYSQGLSEFDAEVVMLQPDSRNDGSPYYTHWKIHSAKASKRGYSKFQKQMDREDRAFWRSHRDDR